MPFEIILATLLTTSYVLDTHSIYIRTHNRSEMIGEFLALANLVQYLSRILIVISVFCISILTETNHKPINFYVIFSVASICSNIVSILLMKSERAADLLCTLVKPAIILSFRNIADQKYWRTSNVQKKISLIISSFTVNTLALIASFLPFIIAENIPQYRMTSVYAGQLLNFFATAIVLTMLEPKAMRLLSTGAADQARASILLGRIISHTLASVAFGVLALK